MEDIPALESNLSAIRDLLALQIKISLTDFDHVARQCATHEFMNQLKEIEGGMKKAPHKAGL